MLKEQHLDEAGEEEGSWQYCEATTEVVLHMSEASQAKLAAARLYAEE